MYIDGLLLSKAYNASVRKFQRNYVMSCQLVSMSISVMTLKGVAKFKGKITRGLKNEIKNLVNFHASS